jgi:hypothetical protein
MFLKNERDVSAESFFVLLLANLATKSSTTSGFPYWGITYFDIICLT